MISFEIFGLSGKKALKVESSIFDQLRGNKCIEDIAVVINNSTSRNIHAVTQPFIRICGCSKHLSASEIKEKLAPLGLKLQRVAISQAR